MLNKFAFQVTDDIGADQNARIHSLCCAIISMQQNLIFSGQGTNTADCLSSSIEEM